MKKLHENPLNTSGLGKKLIPVEGNMLGDVDGGSEGELAVGDPEGMQLGTNVGMAQKKTLLI